MRNVGSAAKIHLVVDVLVALVEFIVLIFELGQSQSVITVSAIL